MKDLKQLEFIMFANELESIINQNSKLDSDIFKLITTIIKKYGINNENDYTLKISFRIKDLQVNSLIYSENERNITVLCYNISNGKNSNYVEINWNILTNEDKIKIITYFLENIKEN